MSPNDFTYDLPLDLIAQEPATDRSASRLMVIGRASGRIDDAIFCNLPSYLVKGDLLIANESRVIPARVRGILPSGGSVEMLLVRHLKGQTWEVIARPGRKLRPGVVIHLFGGIDAKVESSALGGRKTVRFEGVNNVDRWLQKAGELPIPPYIKQYKGDPNRYQTVYSGTPGSIAAPTAGLHFTPTLLDQLADSGIQIQFVTLHVGPGTFMKVQEEDMDSLTLEPEQGSISSTTALAIQEAKRDQRRVLAVGTTTTRLLEGVHRSQGSITEWSGPIDLFIKPPFSFETVDGLITNFHLPRSTLLMLVSAFAGRSIIERAYAHALSLGYRFYTFGDAMFIQ